MLLCFKTLAFFSSRNLLAVSVVPFWEYFLKKIFIEIWLIYSIVLISGVQQSVQFIRSVVSDSLRPQELQDARPPCPSPTSGVQPNPCPSSQWCHPTFSSSVISFSSYPQSFPASGSFPLSQLFRWPKYWSFSFKISPTNEHPGLISLRMDWLDLLAVQGTLKSLLQPHSSKASILRCSAFFIVQLSHPYMTTAKWLIYIYMHILFHYGLSQDIEYSSLCCA